MKFGGLELIPRGPLPISHNPPLAFDVPPRLSEHAATTGSEWLRGGYRLTLSGTIRGERVSIDLDRRDVIEGIDAGWTVEELALVRRRLDRFARREI